MRWCIRYEQQKTNNWSILFYHQYPPQIFNNNIWFNFFLIFRSFLSVDILSKRFYAKHKQFSSRYNPLQNIWQPFWNKNTLYFKNKNCCKMRIFLMIFKPKKTLNWAKVKYVHTSDSQDRKVECKNHATSTHIAARLGSRRKDKVRAPSYEKRAWKMWNSTAAFSIWKTSFTLVCNFQFIWKRVLK